VLVVVDACQLRCGAADIRADLERGFAVMITGSKFAGGPAFCGALLLPATLAERLAQAEAAGPALAPYSAALDWPAALRRPFAAGLSHAANLGLGLRWSAALAEIEAFEAIPPKWRAAMLDDFDRTVRAHIDADRGLALADRSASGAAQGLIAIVHTDGADPRAIYEALQRGEGGARRCHLGQPVAIGASPALRVCASMPMITGAAEQGFAGVEADLDEVFRSWARLRA
jgi:selenocysteine lyase/cysteine desulfurase